MYVNMHLSFYATFPHAISDIFKMVIILRIEEESVFEDFYYTDVFTCKTPFNIISRTF